MSTVIKAGQALTKAGTVRAVNLNDHVAEARAIVERARLDAEHSRVESERESQSLFKRVREEAYAQGYEEGIVTGREAGRKAAYADATQKFEQQHKDVVATFLQAIEGIESLRANLSISAERDLLRFSVGLASHLTYAIGVLDEKSAKANLQRALRIVGTKSDLRIQVHPNDLSAIRDFADEVLEKLGDASYIEVTEDESMQPGGCRVRTMETEVDATLEHQLDQLVRLLLGEASIDG